MVDDGDGLAFGRGDLVQDFVSIIQPLMKKNENTLKVECPADSGTIRADLNKIRQTPFNLLQQITSMLAKEILKS